MSIIHHLSITFQSTNQPINQSINRWINQPTSGLFNRLYIPMLEVCLMKSRWQTPNNLRPEVPQKVRRSYQIHSKFFEDIFVELKIIFKIEMHLKWILFFFFIKNNWKWFQEIRCLFLSRSTWWSESEKRRRKEWNEWMNEWMN